jgi:hypothetical protein
MTISFSFNPFALDGDETTSELVLGKFKNYEDEIEVP